MLGCPVFTLFFNRFFGDKVNSSSLKFTPKSKKKKYASFSHRIFSADSTFSDIKRNTLSYIYMIVDIYLPWFFGLLLVLRLLSSLAYVYVHDQFNLVAASA